MQIQKHFAICNSNQKWNNETCQYSVKIIVHARKIIVGTLAHEFERVISIKKVLLILQGSRVMKLYLLCILYQ